LEKFNIAIDEETSAVAELTMTWNIIDPIDIDESKKRHVFQYVNIYFFLFIT
jgi:hypothetical protein